MNILITGANGQLGNELCRQLSLSHNVVGLSSKELDITENRNVEIMISKICPDLIIHSAAFTAVDQCERDRIKAMDVNGLGTSYLVKTAEKLGARMFYISSDYVFDGGKTSSYHEEDKPNPQSIYGLSKWLGEKFVLQFNNGTIIRTSWLYGHQGKNFVKTMMELSKKNKEVSVVNDQVGSPTYVNDLITVISQLIYKKNGIYHVTNAGECTWFTFAKMIFEEAGANPDLVRPISTQEYGAPAPRPRYSVLGNKSLIKENIAPPRDWKDALKEFMRKEMCK